MLIYNMLRGNIAIYIYEMLARNYIIYKDLLFCHFTGKLRRVSLLKILLWQLEAMKIKIPVQSL